MGDQDLYYARVAGNFTDRQDFAEHDRETGHGGGLGAGWRHYLTPWTNRSEARPNGWQYGVRLDLFALRISYRDPGPRFGHSNILVLQPSAEFGYGWSTPGLGRLELNLGLGAEINVNTDGEDVGEGAIALLGLTWIP